MMNSTMTNTTMPSSAMMNGTMTNYTMPSSAMMNGTMTNTTMPSSAMMNTTMPSSAMMNGTMTNTTMPSSSEDDDDKPPACIAAEINAAFPNGEKTYTCDGAMEVFKKNTACKGEERENILEHIQKKLCGKDDEGDAPSCFKPQVEAMYPEGKGITCAGIKALLTANTTCTPAERTKIDAYIDKNICKTAKRLSTEDKAHHIVLCKGQERGNYCDGEGDCTEHPEWCACPKAQALCKKHQQ